MASEKRQIKSGLSKLGLTGRVQIILDVYGYKTIKQLCSATEADILRLPGMGRKAIKEIREQLSDYKLSLRTTNVGN